jgi:plasmid maintenance system killer protein
MARGNNRTINVKIPTARVIKALENRLAVIKAEYKAQDELEAKYQQSYEQWKKKVAKLAVSKVNEAQNLRTNYRAWTKTLNVDFDIAIDEKDFPAEPSREFETMTAHSYNDTVDEIENALRILKLTDDEVVSTSTYNSIAQYL